MKLVIVAALLVVLAACISASQAPVSLKARANACNGDSKLCSKKYSNVTYVGTHDSFSVGDRSKMGANQEVKVTKQLQDGIRALEIQGQKGEQSQDSPSGINLCHTSCAINDGGSLESYLKDVNNWLKQNPNEVVTIIISNPDNLPVAQWAKGFESSGIKDMAYTSSSGTVSKNDWPTLQEMISKNQRVVVFMDYKTNPKQTNYILPEFSNVWNDPYDQLKIPFNCTPDRFQGHTNQMMYLHNHFINQKKSLFGKSFTVPDTGKLDSTNSKGQVLSSANSCAKDHHNYPTFILVDYYDTAQGGALQAAAQMNGVQYNPPPNFGKSSQSRSGAVAIRALGLTHLAGVAILAIAYYLW